MQSDVNILELIEVYDDLITPFNIDYLQPASYDLHFSMKKGVIVPPVAEGETVAENFSRIVIPPQELVLISTLEKVHIPRGYVARVEGVSSLGRIGLLVHITAGFIDPNFDGNITLEVFNLNKYPVVLEDGCRICQLAIQKLEKPNNLSYDEISNHYQYQEGTTPSKYEETFRGSHYYIERDSL